MSRDTAARLVRAWLATALLDGIFSSALSVLAYHSTVARLWQGVASVLLGPTALVGGARTVLIGLLMHLGVALGWTLAFFALLRTWPALRRMVATPGGVLAVAAIYGPIIWIVMSFVVIPTLTGRPTTLTPRWWVQFFGHIPAVALPIVALLGRGEAARSPPTPAATTQPTR